jgi:predicted LPLAT superfamily acyltransferase
VNKAAIATREHRGWLEVAEKGSVLGIKSFVWMVTFLGRRVAHAVLALVIFYYTIFHRGMRTSSQKYLARLGRPNGFWDAYRHSLCFGQCIVDRVFFVRGEVGVFEVDRTGHEHLRKLHDEKRGAILLGAHFGSFQAMRAFAEEKKFRINVLVNNANAQMINRVLVGLNPDTQVRMLEVSGGLDFIFRVRERIEAGELVAVMGDRVGPDGREAVVPFLGSPARFPTGAYQLAASLGCPIYLTVGIFRGGNRYSLFCEPFADEVKLSRKDREGALAEYARRYAERLEHYCRESPENWFNFFDFWKEKA